MSDLEKTSCGELLCSRCLTHKPRADFKRILSRAQAKQVGYSGDRRVPITSTLCKACRPKRKPAAKLTRKELINRIQGGDIRPFVGQAMLKEREEKAKAKMSRAISQAWEDARRQTWYLPYDELRQERRRFQAVCDYRFKAGPQSLFHFSVTYLAMLERLRSQMHRMHLNEDRTAMRVAPYTDWQDYADEELVQNVRHAWEMVPTADQLKLRHHPALLTFRPEHRRAPPAAPKRPAKKGDTPPRQEK